MREVRRMADDHDYGFYGKGLDGYVHYRQAMEESNQANRNRYNNSVQMPVSREPTPEEKRKACAVTLAILFAVILIICLIVAFLGWKDEKDNKKDTHLGVFFMVPVAGVEPARCRHRRILSPLRLPIPSYRRLEYYSRFLEGVQEPWEKNICVVSYI